MVLLGRDGPSAACERRSLTLLAHLQLFGLGILAGVQLLSKEVSRLFRLANEMLFDPRHRLVVHLSSVTGNL